MNTHEAERIAAAIHQLRPDWPTKQLLTLMGHPTMVDRPRRDVVVALSWVACESGTANPYRVLEAGPWWRAVAVEGANSYRLLNRGPWCGICGIGQDQHRDTSHPFELAPDRKRNPDAIAAIVEEMRGRKEPLRAVDESDPEPHTPTSRSIPAREAIVKEDADA